MVPKWQTAQNHQIIGSPTGWGQGPTGTGAAFNFQNFRAPHVRAGKFSEPLMGAALNFQNFRASHGRAQNFQSRDPVFGAAFLEHTIAYRNCFHARPPPPLRKPSPSLVSRFQHKYPDYHLWEKSKNLNLVNPSIPKMEVLDACF